MLLTAMTFGLMLIGDHGNHERYSPPYHLGTPQEEERKYQLERMERDLHLLRQSQERQEQKEEDRELREDSGEDIQEESRE